MIHANDYQQSKQNYTHQLFFWNQHIIFCHIVNKSAQGEEVDFLSCLLSVYNFVEPNKIVNPIILKKHKLFLGVDWL